MGEKIIEFKCFFIFYLFVFVCACTFHYPRRALVNPLNSDLARTVPTRLCQLGYGLI